MNNFVLQHGICDSVAGNRSLYVKSVKMKVVKVVERLQVGLALNVSLTKLEWIIKEWHCCA